MSRPKLRHTWLDATRGLGVILVVHGHVMRGLEKARELPDAAWVSWADFTLYSFHMPLFFLLAGLNLFHSLDKGPRRFLGEKLWTVAWPYVLWSLVQGGVGLVLAGRTNSPMTVESLLGIGWRPIAQFWFLYALMALHLAALLVGRRPWLLLLAGAAAFACSGLAPDGSLVRGGLHGALFYAAGAVLGPRLRDASPPSSLTAGAGLIVCGLLFAACVAACGPLSGMTASARIVLPCAILGVAMALCAGWAVRGVAAEVLAYVGRASMTIYVLHILAASGVRVACKAAGVDPPWPVDVALGLSVGVLAPLAVYAALRRYDLLWPFGLAPRPRRPAPPAGRDAFAAEAAAVQASDR
ncbi:MAG: acyltransferase [Caulobacter sp.]